jgi:hypothetical protein
MVRARVVGAIGEQAVWSLSRMSDTSPDRRDRIDQGHELSDVMDVRGGQADGQRDPGAIDEDVVLASRPAAIDRTWPAFFPSHRRNGSSRSRPRPSTSRSAPRHGACRAGADVAASTPQRPATRADASSTSHHCRNPTPTEGTPKGCPSAARTRCPSGTGDRRCACDQGSACDAGAWAATAQPGATNGRRRSVQARRSLG